jgi:peptidyl-prolyl cis-trans isomerase C
MRNRLGRRAVVGAALVLVFTVGGVAPGRGEEKQAPTAPGGPFAGVVNVNGTVLNEAQFAAALRDAAFLAKADTPEGRRWVVDRMIEQELLRQEALARGLGKSPRVERALERIRRRGLASQVAAQIAKKYVPPSEAEIAKELGPTPQAMDVRVILVTEEELAQKLLKRVLAGEDFDGLAGQYSEVPKGVKAGPGRNLLTRAGTTMYGPAAEKILFAMKKGEAAVLQTEAGFLVVKVDDRKNLPAEEVTKARGAVIEKLQQERRKRVKDEALAPLRRQYPVKLQLKSLADAPNLGPDADPVEGWRAIENVPIAKVGDVQLTLADIFQDYGLYQMILAKPVSRDRQLNDLREAAIEVTLAALEARRQNIPYPANFVSELEALRERLATAELVADINLAVKPEKLSREACRKLFESNRARFLEEERLALSQILVRRKESADEVAAQLAVGLDFAQLARERSVDASAKSGGDLGTLSRSELAKIFSDEGATVVLNQAAARPQSTFTIQTTKGYHVIRARGYQRSGEGKFEQVEEKVRPDCLREERKAAGEKFVAGLRKKANIQIDDAKVLSVKPSEGAPTSNAIHGGRDVGGGAGGTSPHGAMETTSGSGPSPHGSGKGHGAKPSPRP